MKAEYEKYLSYVGGIRFWIIAACFVIVVAGLKSASFFVNTLLLATFATAICLPALSWLKSKKIPETLAVLLVILGLIIVTGLMFTIIGSSVSNFIDKIPFYEEKFIKLWKETFLFLSKYNLADEETFMNTLNPSSIFGLLGTFLSGFGNVLTSSLLVLIIFIFMIFESTTYGRKLKIINPSSFSNSELIRKRLTKYFGIKTLTSLATGLSITIGLLILGVDFPVLWGFLAFILNFIPSIGSFIAAIPGVILALVLLGPVGGLVTAIIYFVVNTVIGNIVEPQLMGKNLGISPLIVFIAMLFWGFILGPVGMLFATPLMIVIKIILDTRPVTRNLGVLISDESEIKTLEKKMDKAE